MEFGICNLSIIPLRFEPSDSAEMVSQLVLGESFTILEKTEKWSKILTAYDNYEGWIDNKQYTEIPETEFNSINEEPTILTNNFIDGIEDKNNQLTTIVIGSQLPLFNNGFFKLGKEQFLYEGEIITGIKHKSEIIKTAMQFINTPYLWGGKSPFGIDCSGFTQLVYKLCGHKLNRDAKDQAKQGISLSFIEESEPGDLAFFDNEAGNIIHVGIIMENNYIIHAHGKVRVDRIDHLGIFNVNTHKHSHKLRVIKKII